jgi:hypothetical protein
LQAGDTAIGSSTYTLRIRAGRFEQSPYFANYVNEQTIVGVVADR